MQLGWWHKTTDARTYNPNFQTILLLYQSICDTTLSVILTTSIKMTKSYEKIFLFNLWISILLFCL